MIFRMRWILALLVPITAWAASPATTQSVSELLGRYPLERARLGEPFWRSKTVWGESVLFIAPAEGMPADADLVLRPSRIRSVRNPQTDEAYEEGRDFRVEADHRRLVLTEGSRIPKMVQAELFKNPHDPGAAGEKSGDPNHWLLWKENGFAPLQMEVDYDTDETWNGFNPSPAHLLLPRTLGILQSGKPLRIAISGDSISAGGNASGEIHKAPFQPAYPALFAAELEKMYGSPITVLNVAVGGYRSEQAMNHVAQVIAMHPDLVIVAYGMNDVGLRDPKIYASHIQQFVDVVSAKCPDAEFILVATSLGNPLWTAIPAEEFPRYRNALISLELGLRHVAIADGTTLWSEILARKRYYDLTGNGLNHPNDFAHRLYAELLLEFLRKS